MTAYRLIGGNICRQDVPGGDWVEMTKDEANALIDRIEALEKALRPFSDFIANNQTPEIAWDVPIAEHENGAVTIRDFRLARTTLSGDTK